MDAYSLVTRQQQIATEKAENAAKLPKRQMYSWLENECNHFLETGKKKMILIPGLRGVGKTTLLLQAYSHLQKKMPRNRIFFLSLDEASGFNFSLSNLQETIENHFLGKPFALEKEKVAIILDEAQYSDKWALALKVLFDQCENALILASGSSAIKLKESADLARRREMASLYPMRLSEQLLLEGKKIPEFDWVEFLRGWETGKLEKYAESGPERDVRGRLDGYLLSGGFPSMGEGDFEKINDLVSRIIHHDIEEALIGVDTNAVEKLVNYLAVSRAGESSVESISGKLGISKPSVLKYLGLLEKAELIFRVRPFSTSSKALRKPNKYYFASACIKAALLSKASPDFMRPETRGEFLENAVFSSLRSALAEKRMKFELFYDPEGCDFIIAFADGNKIAIEVKSGGQSTLQIKKSLEKGVEKGMVISSSPLHLEGKIIIAPKELFFTI